MHIKHAKPNQSSSEEDREGVPCSAIMCAKPLRRQEEMKKNAERNALQNIFCKEQCKAFTLSKDGHKAVKDSFVQYFSNIKH